MRYLCTNCNYIYDEWLWDKEEWIKAWTSFLKLWDYFTCPVCWEYRDSFHEIKDEINYINDDNTSDFMELEHFIDLYLEDDIVEVRVGKYLHPSGEEHRITEISLYDEYGDIVETKFLQVGQEPEVQFDISDIDDFEIRVRCSLHWVWGRKVER